MDACTYESITGLKNYYGFKSLLKNGLWTQRYGCDDDTIVFNRIKTYSGVGVVNLNANQVAVLLNFNSFLAGLSPVSYQQDIAYAQTVDNQFMVIGTNQLVLGLCIVNNFTMGALFGSPTTLTLAIFDLY